MYVNVGLVGKRSQNYYLSLAAQAYKQSLDIETNQIKVVMDYAGILMTLNDYKKAKLLLDHAVKVWPQEQKIFFLRSQACFHLGKFQELQQESLDLKFDQLNSQERSIMTFWQENRGTYETR